MPAGQPPLDITQLPAGVANLLQWALTQEASAVGPRLRPAQRFTRHVLGGAIAAGYPAWLLAEYLDITLPSVRTRAQGDGWLAATRLQAAGIDPADLQHWRHRGLITDEQVGPNNETFYPAADVIRALSTAGPI